MQSLYHMLSNGVMPCLYNDCRSSILMHSTDAGYMVNPFGLLCFVRWNISQPFQINASMFSNQSIKQVLHGFSSQYQLR